MTNYSDNLVSFIWDVADLLRGPYRPPEYRKVMLPMTVLRRLDCVLADTKAKVLEQSKKLKGQSPGYVHKMLQKAAGQQFYNTSKYDFAKLKADPDGLAQKPPPLRPRLLLRGPNALRAFGQAIPPQVTAGDRDVAT